MENKNALFVIRLFAPPITGGTIRVYKFCKYLLNKNFKVFIISSSQNKNKEIKKNKKLNIELSGIKIIDTPGIDTFILQNINKIKSLITKNEIQNNNGPKYKKNKTKILVNFIKLLSNNFITDIWRYLWIPFATRKLKKIIKKYKIKNIITSSPSFSTQLAGLYIKKYFQDKIFWIADFRDLWSLSPKTLEKNDKTKKIINSLEKKVINSADLNIFISNSAKKLVLNHLRISENNIKHTVITNGFDEDDFKNCIFHNNVENKSKIINISYIGSVYGPRMSCLYPEAIKRYINKSVDKNIIFNFIGNCENSYLKRLSKTGAKINIYKHMIHKNAIMKMCEADILVVFWNKSIEGSIAFTGKIFEYFRVGKPIMALFPEGEVTKIISDYNLGSFADPENENDIANKLASMINNIKNGKSYNKLPDKILDSFNREYLTEKLISFLK